MICPKCAAQIPNDAQSCVMCGAVIDSTSVAPAPQAAPSIVDTSKHAATQWHRLVNYFIDSLCIGGFTFLMNALFIPFGTSVDSKELAARPGLAIAYICFSFLFTALYYSFFEGIWQRTPGKWASGTKVVMLDGSKPSLGRTIGRSFARYIPFDQFSFLFGKYPYGWHDSLSKTTVVMASYSVDDVKSINVQEKGKASIWIVILGIVLIILPVIAIIGIMASIMLVSLNTARLKGSDAAVKANLINLNYQGELYFDLNKSYKGVCSSANFSTAKNGIEMSQSAFSCNDSKDAWAASATLNKELWCVDSVGYYSSAVRLGTSTACSGQKEVSNK